MGGLSKYQARVFSMVVPKDMFIQEPRAKDIEVVAVVAAELLVQATKHIVIIDSMPTLGKELVSQQLPPQISQPSIIRTEDRVGSNSSIFNDKRWMQGLTK